MIFSISSNVTIKKYWSVQIGYSFMIIMTLYCYDIFAPNVNENLNDDTLKFIGIIKNENTQG